MRGDIPLSSALASVSLLVLVHLEAGRMHFLERDGWRSAGAGIAMSYVFLDILPHLSSKQRALEDAVSSGLGAYLEHHAYLLALAGFVLYLGLSNVARRLRTSGGPTRVEGKPHPVVQVLVLAVAVYCFLVGYLLGEQPDHRYGPVIIFALAMTIRMAGVGHVVHGYYPRSHHRVFRYVLAGATVSGWLLGIATTVPDVTFALVFAFAVGAILIVAFIYELPAVTGAGAYWPFVAGVTGFSVLLLVYEAVSTHDLAS